MEKKTEAETWARSFAKLVPHLSPKVWARGKKVRVYLRYPRGYGGGAGGGDLGYVDFSRADPSLAGLSAPKDLLADVKNALELKPSPRIAPQAKRNPDLTRLKNRLMKD
jgi:hypothetical protein